MSSQLFLDRGEPIGLGEQIGRGGEGDVHAVAGDPTHAVKIHTVKELTERQAKGSAMVRAGLAARSELVAFPFAVVNRAGGKFAGFRHACRVGVPDYTPPEPQGVALHSVERTVEHDRFGLAVVVFELLVMGRHAFSGAYASGEIPIERAIGEHRFAYIRQRQVGMKPRPWCRR